MSDTPLISEDAVGVTPADLLTVLSDSSDCDVYVSQSLEVRLIQHLLSADVVWVDETCFFRLTPPRFAGLVKSLKEWQDSLKEMRAATPATPEEIAFVAEKSSQVAAAVLVMKQLKTEFMTRWPNEAKRFSTIVPEQLKAPPRASDLWRVDHQRDAEPIIVSQTATEAAAVDLLDWADTNPVIPESPFMPLPFAVVLDGPAWFSRLTAHARASHSNKAIARLRRLRAGKTKSAVGKAATAAEQRRLLCSAG